MCFENERAIRTVYCRLLATRCRSPMLHRDAGENVIAATMIATVRHIPPR
jgi:hypothetical protein